MKKRHVQWFAALSFLVAGQALAVDFQTVSRATAKDIEAFKQQRAKAAGVKPASTGTARSTLIQNFDPNQVNAAAANARPADAPGQGGVPKERVRGRAPLTGVKIQAGSSDAPQN